MNVIPGANRSRPTANALRRGGIGDHPRDEPLLGVVGIGLFRFPPGEDGARREHQEAEAEPQTIARRALTVMTQTGVAQNRDHHQAHHQAHDDRAGEVERADQPGPGGAEVDGGHQQGRRGKRGQQREPGRLQDHGARIQRAHLRLRHRAARRAGPGPIAWPTSGNGHLPAGTLPAPPPITAARRALDHSIRSPSRAPGHAALHPAGVSYSRCDGRIIGCMTSAGAPARRSRRPSGCCVTPGPPAATWS